MFHFHIKILFILVFASVTSLGAKSDFLVRRGWYKTSHKGTKIPLSNITYIDNQIIKATDYLRVNARISRIPTNAIRNLPLVSTLKLIFCGIQDILPGAFQNMTNLATLALNDNELTHISTGVFNKLNITVIFLQRNEIETIDSSAFDDMPNLYRIKLNSNKLSTWDNNWFRNTPHLTELYFRRNGFVVIPSNAFRNIRGSHFSNERTIVDTKIYLSKNNISRIDPNAFMELQEFSQLWLDRNELEKLDSKVFSSLSQVGGIYLGRNRISQIPEQLFSNVKTEVINFDLNGNNNITCLPYDVVSKVKLTNAQNIKRLNCECIRELMKKLSTEKRDNLIKSKCKITELL